jgi:hypothetical protein
LSAKHLSGKNSPRVASHFLDFERICQLVVLLLGARCAYAGRYLPVGADGLAYLDVARSYVRHDWHTAVNGYWGPLYAWLLAAGMRIFRPGIRYELVVARGLNFLIFAAALFAFSKFWRAVGSWGKRLHFAEVANAEVANAEVANKDTSIPGASPLVWTLFGYFLFLVNFIWSVEVVNPDILVAAIVFAGSAVLFALDNNRQHGIGAYAGLGLLLAIGYYAKAILLYFAVFVLAAAAIHAFQTRRLRGPATAMLVFAVLVAPFVILLSKTIGHLTAGDSGRLNYAWFVNGPETKTWERDSSAGAPLPFYPGPVIFHSPRVFRIPSIDDVTYAPWYDATRFDTRSKPRLNFRDQLRQLAINLRYSRQALLGEGAALTVPLLIVVWYAPRESLRRFAATWFCTLPALGIFGMYLLVHLVERFVIGFSLLLWGAAWAVVVVPPGLQAMARRAMLVGIAVFAAYSVPGLMHYIVSKPAESVARDMIIAEQIPQFGLQSGDLVGVIGDGQEAYWAHFARLSIAAEVWRIDSTQFWSAAPAMQQAALRSMADSGAKAVVWRRDSEQPCLPGWVSFREGAGCIISLQ